MTTVLVIVAIIVGVAVAACLATIIICACLVISVDDDPPMYKEVRCATTGEPCWQYPYISCNGCKKQGED